MNRSARCGKFDIPRVERGGCGIATLEKRVSLFKNPGVAIERFEICQIDAGDTAIQKSAPLFRSATNDL